MGLGNSEARAAFITIGNGKMCRQVQEPSATPIERVNKNGKTVHEEFYDSLTGRIVSIEAKDDGDFGKKWEVLLEDRAGERFKLKMSYISGYSGAFLKTLPNVDLSKEVTLIPNLKEEDGKKKTTMFVKQDGRALKHFYNRDNRHGLPEMVQVKVKGKMTWDDSDQMEFLENMVMTEIVPKLLPANVAPATAAGEDWDDDSHQHAEQIGEAAGVTDDDKDLPF